MKQALVAVGLIVALVIGAAVGFLYGTSRYTGQFNVSDLALVGTSARPAGFQFARGQFDPNQMSPEQLQQLRQARGTPGAAQGGNQAGGQRAFGQGGAGGAFGTIESIEGDIITVKTQTGTAKVRATDTTLIDKQMSVTVQELKVGDQVSWAGSQGTDGVTTARSIRVLPALPSR